MIDDGELDWKVIAINSEDALAAQLNDISDVEAKLPGVVSGKFLPIPTDANHIIESLFVMTSFQAFASGSVGIKLQMTSP